jgi:UDP-N-acetyl-D-glucosamine dehydrogenase
MRKHDLQMRSIELTDAALTKYDCVIIATHHSSYDWPRIVKTAKLIIDTRNATAGVPGRRDHIVTA